jgi:hypothetical protein
MSLSIVENLVFKNIGGLMVIEAQLTYNSPTGLKQTTTTSTSITIEFTPPLGTITTYSAVINDVIKSTSLGSPITITGLNSGTEYNVTIISRDSNGKSIPSFPLLCGTLLDAPTINNLTPSSPSRIIVSFTPPPTGIVTSYKYTANSTLGNFTGIFTSSSNSYTINGLNDGAIYTVTLKAINSYGSSITSNSVECVLLLDIGLRK